MKGQNKSGGKLDDLRKRIRDVDAAILDLIGQRQDLARQVGAAKFQAGMAIKDPKVEAKLLASLREKAQDIGIYEDIAEDVFRTLIDYSCKAQEDFRNQARTGSPSNPRRVLIVGGAGRMGQWFARFLSSYGHDVKIHDLNPPPGKSSFPFVKDLASELKQSNIVILATPISVTPAILEKIIAIGTKALVFDTCSIKAPVLSALEKAKKAGIRVTSIHPMFGSQVKSLAGRNILFCETGDKETTKEAISLFSASAARLQRLDLNKHDEYMAYVLGLSHLLNLVFSAALADSGLSFADFSSTGSTTFDAQTNVSRLVAEENPDLYFEIQVENAATPAVMEVLKKSLANFSDAIRGKDKKAFRELMDKGRIFFKSEEA